MGRDLKIGQLGKSSLWIRPLINKLVHYIQLRASIKYIRNRDGRGLAKGDVTVNCYGKMSYFADTGGWMVENWSNFADVLYGCPLH